MPTGEPEDKDLERSLKNVKWVNSVLNSHKALSLKQLTISFCIKPKTFDQVSEWLHFAFSRRVESLELNFECAPFVLDVNILSSIQCSDYKFLKELTLEDLDVSGEAIEFLQCNCLLLERLIVRAFIKSDVVFGGTLKYLEISPGKFSGKIIKISAPNLTQLICNCMYEFFFLENVPNLVHASFFLRPEDTMHTFANAAAKLETLTIILKLPQAFSVPLMPKLKKLVLKYDTVDMFRIYLLPVTCLLEASPCLEEFKLEISDLYKYYPGQSSSICKAIFKLPKLGGFQHDHLKVFEFSGFCHRGADNVALVRYIANSCVGLEEMIITPISTILARQFELRDGSEYEKRRLLSEEVDVIAQKQQALDMKKSTEKVLEGNVHQTAY